MNTHELDIPEKSPDPYHDAYSRTVFGFWLYLMSDFVLFGALFATYAVLSQSTFGWSSGRELFQTPFNLTQTLILLFTSFTAGLGGTSAHRKHTNYTILYFGITFVLGAIFIGMELYEFSRLIGMGSTWDRSAFLSAYFTVVGTHAVHIIFALIWIPVLLIPVIREGITPVSIRRLTCLRMFWQFLNIIWVFIFSIVYLLGGE